MKRPVILFLCILLFGYLDAQKVEDSVKAVVKQLFDGMRNSDALKIRGVFSDSAILQTIVISKDGKTSVQNDSVDEFAKLVSTLKKGAADEQIIFESIRIDGPLAMVWAPYKFYFDGNFSHCGIDSFQLILIDGQWKIQYLIDTRRKQPCN